MFPFEIEEAKENNANFVFQSETYTNTIELTISTNSETGIRKVQKAGFNSK